MKCRYWVVVAMCLALVACGDDDGGSSINADAGEDI